MMVMHLHLSPNHIKRIHYLCVVINTQRIIMYCFLLSVYSNRPFVQSDQLRYRMLEIALRFSVAHKRRTSV